MYLPYISQYFLGKYTVSTRKRYQKNYIFQYRTFWGNLWLFVGGFLFSGFWEEIWPWLSWFDLLDSTRSI